MVALSVLVGWSWTVSSFGPGSLSPAPLSSTTVTPSAVTVCYMPGENCTDTIVQVLGNAKRIVLVQAYIFTSAPIAKAILDAHKRGIQVQVILFPGQPGRIDDGRREPRDFA